MYKLVSETNNYLKHHGILGQKWGVRRFQNADGTLTSEGKARLGRIGSAKYNKETRKINREQKGFDKIQKAREKNRAKIEAKMDKKIEKNSTNKELKKAVELKKAAKLADFDAGTKAISKAQKDYINILKDHRDARIAKIDNPEFKKSFDYYYNKKAYANQKLSDIVNYGSAGTTLGYAGDHLSGKHNYTVNKNLAKTRYNMKNEFKSAIKNRPDRHERAANASDRDAADLRKHGYTKEADAVQKVADSQRAKSKTYHS